jgi:hypothetical protein
MPTWAWILVVIGGIGILGIVAMAPDIVRYWRIRSCRPPTHAPPRPAAAARPISVSCPGWAASGQGWACR